MNMLSIIRKMQCMILFTSFFQGQILIYISLLCVSGIGRVHRVRSSVCCKHVMLWVCWKRKMVVHTIFRAAIPVFLFYLSDFSIRTIISSGCCLNLCSPVQGRCLEAAYFLWWWICCLFLNLQCGFPAPWGAGVDRHLQGHPKGQQGTATPVTCPASARQLE